jgi:glucan phosphoethanolaminetransferase (alkaline phosphatase superfamily)
LKKADREEINIKFEPYIIEENGIDENQNVFVIMGESMSTAHMSLYGYRRETTPKLDNIKKTEENFQMSLGMSSSICTGTSFALFFNVIGEVGNSNEINSKTANLFKLAKNKGFTTFYISAQENALLSDILVKYIDHIKTKDTGSILFNIYKDEALIKILNELDLEKNKKNFVVINLRTPHSPYVRRYEHQKEKYNKFKVTKNDNDNIHRINTYDNAMLYTDNVIAGLIETIKEKSKYSYYVFMTSDHSELFGEEGIWGHCNLVLENAKVPFIVMGSKKILGGGLPPIVSHYDIGKMIIRQLGYELKNKNEEEGIRYVFSADLNGNYDFIKYKINGDKIEDLGRSNIREYYKLAKPSSS